MRFFDEIIFVFFIQLKSQISIYEIRLHDNEDSDKRSQNEIIQLKRDIQQISQENEDRIHEINVQLFQRVIYLVTITAITFCRNGDANMKH